MSTYPAQTAPTAPTAADDLAQSFANHHGYYVGAQKHLFYVRMCANGTLYYANRPNITAADVATADNAAERAVHHAEFACQFVARHLAAPDAATVTVDAATADEVITEALVQANIAKERAFIARQRANAIIVQV